MSTLCKSTSLIFIATLALGGVAYAENPDIAVRRANERTSFSDAEIADGFFKTAMRAELHFDRVAERIRKFDGPVRIFIAASGALHRRAEVAAVVADIRAHVKELDIAVTEDRKEANFVVTLVSRSDLKKTIIAHFGAVRALQIERSLAPECLSGIGKDENFRIRRAEAILPADVGDFSFYDCAYEELLQGLGIINDDNSVPWTMFNDDVQMGFFDVYDQHLVNILYDPRIRPGMTRNAVEKVLPDVLPDVRSWISSNNP